MKRQTDAGTTTINNSGGRSSTTQSAVHAGTAAPVIAVAEVVGATDPSMAHKGAHCFIRMHAEVVGATDPSSMAEAGTGGGMGEG